MCIARSCPQTTLSKWRNAAPLDAKNRMAANSSGLILQEPIFSCKLNARMTSVNAVWRDLRVFLAMMSSTWRVKHVSICRVVGLRRLDA